MPPGPEGAALLRSCLDRLNWGAERLAREINRIAGPETVSPKAPYGWLKGSVPRGRVPQHAALALSRGLGEHVSAAALWPTARAGGVAVTAHHGLDLAWTAYGAYRCAQLISEPTDPALVAISGPLLVEPVVDWLTVPPAGPPARDGGELISPQVLAVLTERISQLRRLDDVQSGALLLDWITQDLRWAARLACTGSYDAETGAWLYRILAELAQLGGWVATDLGRRALGQRLLLAALHFAHAAADRDLAAHIVSCLSYLSLWMETPADAVRLIRLARQATGPRAGSVAAALLASREARAHAALGDTDALARALEDAQRAYTSSSDSPTPRWAYWITEAVLTADAGRAWLEAGEPGRAAQLLERGLDLFGDTLPRNRVLHGVSLAHARLATRDVDGAVAAADAALDLLCAFDSARAYTRLTELRTELERTGAGESARVVERIDELVHA